MTNQEGEPRFSASVSLDRRTLWFGTLTLHEDHLTISGWTWTGFSEWQIPINDIRHVVRWSSSTKGPNFGIRRKSGPSLYCRVEGAFHLAKHFEQDERVDLKIGH